MTMTKITTDHATGVMTFTMSLIELVTEFVTPFKSPAALTFMPVVKAKYPATKAVIRFLFTFSVSSKKIHPFQHHLKFT